MPSLVVACMAKNEADSYFASALDAWNEFADRIVVLNDNSTDGTADLARDRGAFVVDWTGDSAWGKETPPRKALWEAAVQSGCDWIFVLDADMVPARDPRDLLVGGIDGICFYLYDLWGDSVFRSDYYWKGHTVPRLWLVRSPKAQHSFGWSGRNIHSGHLPTDLRLERVVTAPRDYSLLHYAYATTEDRTRRKNQYLAQGKYLTTHEWLHASSIDDPEPSLLPLDIDVTWPLRKSSLDPASDKT